ncbi:MAG: gamma-glutamylcyclotransferase family protein [Pirellulales bacterium]
MPTEAQHDAVAAVFVYGTLKRGECRQRCWPRVPIAVEPAVIRGRLYDLGPYPALGPGDDRVRGELWCFDVDAMPETLRVLDEVEGATQLGDFYYRRIILTCECDDGQRREAFAYEFADLDRLKDKPIVPPDASGECCWNGGADLEEIE